MTRRNPPDHPTTAGKDTVDSARDQRRAQALRANLKRRKAQLRGRAAAEQIADEHPSAAEHPIKSP